MNSNLRIQKVEKIERKLVIKKKKKKKKQGRVQEKHFLLVVENIRNFLNLPEIRVLGKITDLFLST